MSERDEARIRPLDPDFVIALPQFQGPLDLLLHLIQKHELDILDLPIAFVTERYLAYLSLMQQLDLDVASEYLLMAATLAHIKSRMLLPPDPTAAEEDAVEEEDDVDPRAELIRKLLEYQKYKSAAEELGARGIAGRDVFFRGIPVEYAQGPAPLAEVGLFALLDAFQKVLARKQVDLSREISVERISISERMSQITERLAMLRRTTFDELFEDVRTTYEVVVTFLALLEMAKMRLLRVYQTDAYGTLYLESAVADAGVPADTPEAAHCQPRVDEPIDGEAGLRPRAAGDTDAGVARAVEARSAPRPADEAPDPDGDQAEGNVAACGADTQHRDPEPQR
jgi:segregation and condensation protein A